MLIVATGKSLYGPLPQQSDTLWQCDTEFAQKPANLVGQGCARLDQPGACPVQRQHCLLHLRLDRYEAHVRSLYRLADGLGVSRVGLVALYVRPDELRGDQSDGVSELCELPAPVVRRAACFHANHTRFKRGEIPKYMGVSGILCKRVEV
ncbi:hypothetical protein B0G71_7806 [Paraburkholderia sp. BL27I4N3]|nr:hypothetical protein B0G71_7806 [Paraburkholderia sp. BL27I4N3]